MLCNVFLLRSNDPNVQLRSVSALFDLAYNNQKNRDAINEAGAIPLLTDLLNSNNLRVKVMATAALMSLDWNRQENTTN